MTPRWFALAQFANVEDAKIQTPGVLLVIDSSREVNIGLGRAFSKILLKKGEAFITKSALKYLRVDKDSKSVQLVIDINKYINLTSMDSFLKSPLLKTLKLTDRVSYNSMLSYYAQYKYLAGNLDTSNIPILRLNYRVVDTFDAPNGKFADTYGNTMIIDYKYIIPDLMAELNNNFVSNILQLLATQNQVPLQSNYLQYMVDQSTSQVDMTYFDTLSQPIVDIKLEEYALEVDAVLKNREHYYMSSHDVRTL